MTKKTYQELLLDPKWQRKRLEILDRAKFACELCGETEKTLHVHHKLYRKGANPWEYENDELHALCKDCHEQAHEIRKALDICIAVMDPGDVQRLLGYAQGLLTTGFAYDHTKVHLRNREHAEGVVDTIVGHFMAAEHLLDMRDKDDCVSREALEELRKQFRDNWKT